jgi:hypothetical protein
MPDILHKVGIKSTSLDEVYSALATVEGLSRWWTSDTRGDSKVGGDLQFRFGDGGFDMKGLELNPGKRVLWQVGRRPRRMARHQNKLRSQTERRLDRCSVQASRLEGAGGVHAPLQHQMGGVSAESEVAARNR